MSGVFWAVAAGFGFGLFQTFHRKAGQNLDALRGTFILLAVSSAILIAAAVLTSDVSMLQSASLGALLAFAVAGFIHFFVGWTLIGISQAQIGAARTSAASTCGCWPNSMPPLFTWGQEAFTSIPATRGTPERRLHTSA